LGLSHRHAASDLALRATDTLSKRSERHLGSRPCIAPVVVRPSVARSANEIDGEGADLLAGRFVLAE
jgi:hypothetical protein